MPLPLPIDAFVPEIVGAVRSARAAVVTAAPGAGKTTRVPPALVGDGRTLLLQPRRVAARAIARWIAHEQGWTLGREVGWHVRFDRNFIDSTRLIVATEGILTARFQQDPLVEDLRTIIIDEFHERSIHADLGLALAREAWRARDDLRVVVMSATIAAAQVAAYLDDCPVIDVPGRLHAIDVSYEAQSSVSQAIARVLPQSRGAVLCFLPGAGEIRRAGDELRRDARRLGIPETVPIMPLHGSLDANEQDAALAPTDSPRIVLATNLAETTLTVPDVTAVVDTGLHKVARYDADRAIDSLETERISQDSADQRAGRAGRVQAGTVVRLWDERDRLRPHREPEIARVDLASVVLDVLGWGGRPRELNWFEAPPAGALDAAMALLRRLEAIDTGESLTSIGRSLRRLPLHPRLARILLAGKAAQSIARACALLSERHLLPPRHGAHQATTCDLLSSVDGDLPGHISRVARELREVARSAIDRSIADRLSDDEFRRAIFAGYPDRLARRRATGGDRFVLATGTGARLGRESGVINAEFIVAVDVTSGSSAAAGSEALIRIATGVEAEWIVPTSVVVEHRFDADSKSVRSARIERYDDLILREHAVAPDPLAAGEVLAAEYLRRGPADSDRELLNRVAFAGLTIDFKTAVRDASAGLTRLDDVQTEKGLPTVTRRELDRLAPRSLKLPSGREVPLEYRDAGVVAASVKMQQLFGLADSPRLGPRQTPITFELLAPSGRPVQVTSDLRGFWTRTYPEVRKQLSIRYPKHKWPERPV